MVISPTPVIAYNVADLIEQTLMVRFVVFVLLVVSFAHDLFFKREVSIRETPGP